MDARDWHRQATTPPPEWPAPLSPAEYDALSRSAQHDYFAHLSAALNGQILVSKPMEAIQSHLDDIVETNLLRPAGAKQMVAVIAPYSAGKSTLVKHWGFGVHRADVGDQASSSRPTWSPEPGVTADLVPVVYVSLMSSSSIKEINALILLYLGYPSEGVVRTTTVRVLHALRMHRVRVLILDDANMLRATNVQMRVVLDYIKFLNTELGEISNGTVVVVGSDRASKAILDDPQIRARLTVLSLEAFKIATVKEKAAWQDLLSTAAERPLQHLPDASPDLFITQLAQHIWRRTQGFVGEVAKLIAGSVLDAVHDRRSVITHDDLDAIKLSERSIDGQAEEAAKAKKSVRR